MRIPIHLGAAVLGLHILTSSPAQAQGCLSSTESFAQNALEAYRTRVSSSDSVDVKARAALDLPHMVRDSVSIVTDSSTCASAAQSLAVATAFPELGPGPVWVLRIGATRYFVADPRRKTTDRALIGALLNEQFHVLRVLYMP